MTPIPPSPLQRFLHLAKQWQTNANKGDYVAPDEYARIMKDSAFALCPKARTTAQPHWHVLRHERMT